MLSESARMNSAAEGRYRIQAPNSLPRAIKVIALDAPGEAIVRRLAEEAWSQASFFTAAGPGAAASHGGLRDLDGAPRDLAAEVASADLVVMVATAGGNAAAARAIGEACSDRRVMTTALVAHAGSSPDDALSKTLAQLRPWSLMTVVADVDDYIGDMLIALRA